MPASAYKQTLGFLLSDTARLLRKRFEQRARHLGLTRAQWQTLAFLARNEGIQQSALAEILELEAITLGRIVDRLEAAGLIRRGSHPTDRRVWQLFLEPKAHELLRLMSPIGEATRTEALDGVSPEDAVILTRVLLRMKGNLVIACDKPVDLGNESRQVVHG